MFSEYKETTSSASSAPQHNQDVPRILVVEDDKANRMIIQWWLEEFGYSFEIVENGEDAIEKFKTGDFAIILMDVEMAGMNGYDTTKAIRSHERSNSLNPVTIIALTANAFVGDTEKCISAGMDDYFSKPINYAELNERIAKYTAQIMNARSGNC